MPADLAALRRQWQACLVQARAAMHALAKAEAAYIAAHRERAQVRPGSQLSALNSQLRK